MGECNMIQALNKAYHQEFSRSDKLLTFGEDVGAFGGVFRVTSGLTEAFSEQRCFNTPLSEAGIVGFAIGLAQIGLKPIAEMQFADYVYPAFDQIVNELAKMRYRTNGQYTANMVIRMPYGGGIHGGVYHSQSPEAYFLHTAGLHVVFPASPYEAKGLFASAIEANDPVLFFEPKRLYRMLKEEVPEERYLIPFGKLDLALEGKDVTLIGYGAQHHENMRAALELKEQGVSVEVLNLRTLNPLDLAGILRSIVKTGKCVIAHEAPYTMGFGAELSSLITEHAFYHLEAPPIRCTGLDTPFPHTLEEEYLPGKERVIRACLKAISLGEQP